MAIKAVNKSQKLRIHGENLGTVDIYSVQEKEFFV